MSQKIQTAPVRRVLKKNVSTIHINARLTLTQRKLVNALLYNAYEELLSEDTHSIPVSLLSEMIGFDSRNQAHLRQAIRGLTETSVEWDILEDDGTSVWEVSSLLSSARIRAGVCTYRYDKGLAEKLKHPDIYSKINLSVIRELRSSHALALYENCYRYVDIGHTAWWDLDVFRKLMSVDGLASYQEYKILKRDLITPSMREINKLSNINVEMETRRKGRSVIGLRFLVKYNKQPSLVGMEEEDEISESRAYLALREQGISKTLARSWALEYEEAYIFEKLDLASSQVASGKIRSSKAGFLKSAIEEDYHNESAVKKKAQSVAQTAKQAREKLERKLEALKTAQREAEISYRRHVAEIIEDAFQGLPEEQRDATSKEFQLSLGSAIYINAFKKGGWKDRLSFPDVVRFWKARGLSLPSPADWAQKNGSQEPDAIRTKVEALEAQINGSVNLVKSK
jgi:hypothetical protein